MAKKSTGQKLVAFEYWDSLIYDLYADGVIQSTIIHTIILLFMALVLIKEPTPKPITLELSFSSTPTTISVDEDSFPSIEILEEASSQEVSSRNIPYQNTSIPNHEEELSVELADLTDDSLAESEILTLLDLDPKILNTQVLPEQSQKIKKPVSKSHQEAHIAVGQAQGLDTLGSGDKDNGKLSDIKKRLKQANAGTGDLQISIAWDSVDDVDLHVNYISSKLYTNSYICWIHKLGLDRGFLDVDRNAFPTSLTNKPIENIFWPDNSNPQGQIIVGLHLFKNWSGKMSVPVTLVINNKGHVTTHNAIVIYGDQPKEVLRFKIN